MHTPIVVNGIVYVVTEFHLVLALSASTGSIIWSKQIPVLTFTGGPNGVVAGGTPGHFHAIWYTSQVLSKPLLWVVANNYTIFAYNALSGDVALRLNPYTPGEKITGNYGRYGTVTPQIVIDEPRDVLIFGDAVSEGSDAGRGYFRAFDLTTTPPKVLWTQFVIPPQDGSNPNWDIQSVNNMTYAYLFNGKSQIDLKALSASQLNVTLYNDWGGFHFNGTGSWAGGGPGWGGSWADDPATGIAYVATSQPSPDWNATARPGPNLWTDSVWAVNVKTGKIIWAQQATAHDLWDWDCSWSVILANATVNGQTQKEVFKGCKNGYVYALNAATGKMDWNFEAPSIKRYPWTQLLDPLNKTQMQKPWETYPAKGWFLQNPPSSGSIESDPSFDPVSNTVYVGTYNFPLNTTYDKGVLGKGNWGNSGRAQAAFTNKNNNATIWAVNVNNGQPRWHFDIPAKVGFRGGLINSNGVVYVPAADGNMYFLDASNGKLLATKFIGTAMITQPALAQDANSNWKVIQPAAPAGARGLLGIGGPAPGIVFALGLSAPPAGAVTTSTITGPGVTSTVQAPTTGIDPTTFYSVAAVAVVFVITTGVLAVRRRNP